MTRTYSQDLALYRLFFRGIRYDDAAGGSVFLFNAADENAVMQRAELHGINLFIER